MPPREQKQQSGLPSIPAKNKVPQIKTKEESHDYHAKLKFGRNDAGRLYIHSMRGKRHEDAKSSIQDRATAFRFQQKDITTHAIANALKDTFATMSYFLARNSAAYYSGSTFTVVVHTRIQGKLYRVSAQVGDSAAKKMIRRGGKRYLELVTEVHKTSNKSEFDRVKHLGAKFSTKNQVLSHDGCYYLDMTRSLGDDIFKPVVIDTPSISIAAVEETEESILGSDGLFDTLSDETIISSLTTVNFRELCAIARNYLNNKDDTTCCATRHLSALQEGEVLVKAIADGHGKEGEKIAKFLIENLEAIFKAKLKNNLQKKPDEKSFPALTRPTSKNDMRGSADSVHAVAGFYPHPLRGVTPVLAKVKTDAVTMSSDSKAVENAGACHVSPTRREELIAAGRAHLQQYASVDVMYCYKSFLQLLSAQSQLAGGKMLPSAEANAQFAAAYPLAYALTAPPPLARTRYDYV